MGLRLPHACPWQARLLYPRTPRTVQILQLVLPKMFGLIIKMLTKCASILLTLKNLIQNSLYKRPQLSLCYHCSQYYYVIWLKIREALWRRVSLPGMKIRHPVQKYIIFHGMDWFHNTVYCHLFVKWQSTKWSTPPPMWLLFKPQAHPYTTVTVTNFVYGPKRIRCNKFR